MAESVGVETEQLEALRSKMLPGKQVIGTQKAYTAVMIPNGGKNQSSMTNRLPKSIIKSGIFDDGDGLGAMPYLIHSLQGRNGASNGTFIYGLTSFICAKSAMDEVLFF